MAISSNALRKLPEAEPDDVSWAFRLMARWLGDASRESENNKARVQLSAAEKIVRAKQG